MIRHVRFSAVLAVVVVSVGAVASAPLACRDNSFAGTLQPVPPVYRLPKDMEGTTILIAEDPMIETRDPVHIARAKDGRVPQQFRDAMTKALALGGFRVTSSPAEPHDMVAKLALNVSEDGEHIKQVYRCGLSAPDGSKIAQIDWTWPEGTFVDVYEVFDFATHNLATEVVKSPAVIVFVRRRASRPSAAPAAADDAPIAEAGAAASAGAGAGGGADADGGAGAAPRSGDAGEATDAGDAGDATDAGARDAARDVP